MTSPRNYIESARAELPAPVLAGWASIFFSLAVLTFLISLTVSQTFLAAAAVAYGAHVLRTRTVPHFPPVKLSLALFCLFSILSIFWAENPAVGWFAVRKLVLFLILLLSANLVASPRHLKLLFQGLFLEAALVGLVAVFQFARQYQIGSALPPGQVYVYMRQARAHGLMGHWMNFGGQQMLAFAAFVAFLLLAARQRKIWWMIGGIVAVSIVLNFSRGIWLGSFVACIYLVARWRPRWLWLLPVFLVALYFTSPNLIRERLLSVLHPTTDPSVAIRFEMWRVGWRMIQSHPFLGVGPNNIPETYALYLPPGETPIVGYHDHLHDDFLQFGAERGLPCLIAWLWLMGGLGWHTLRIRRGIIRGDPHAAQAWIADAAFACLLAFLTEGCFEFNFGTSPVLMVFLFIASTPFVVERAERLSNNPPRVGESQVP